MIMRAALPLLALLRALARARSRRSPLPALAEQRQCPAYPLPPAELLKPPVKIDFLTPTG